MPIIIRVYVSWVPLCTNQRQCGDSGSFSSSFLTYCLLLLTWLAGRRDHNTLELVLFYARSSSGERDSSGISRLVRKVFPLVGYPPPHSPHSPFIHAPIHMTSTRTAGAETGWDCPRQHVRRRRSANTFPTRHAPSSHLFINRALFFLIVCSCGWGGDFLPPIPPFAPA